MDRFTDRTVVITGGGSGIGKATAVRVAAEGAKVVIVDMNPDAGSAVAEEVGGTGVVGPPAVPTADGAAVGAGAAVRRSGDAARRTATE